MTKNSSIPFSAELSVGDVATRSGVAVSAIHFYESKGLITSWRNSGNQRRYPREALRRVSIIKVAQRLGIPLASIKQALDSLPKGRTPTDQDWKKLSARWHAELDERITKLTELRKDQAEYIGVKPEGPFKAEVHTHMVLPSPDGNEDRSVLVDRVDYEQVVAEREAEHIRRLGGL